MNFSLSNLISRNEAQNQQRRPATIAPAAAAPYTTVQASIVARNSQQPITTLHTKTQGAWSHDAYLMEQEEADPTDQDHDMGRDRTIRIKQHDDLYVEQWRMRVTNLHWNVSESDLRQIIGASSLESVKIKYDLSGRSEGSADLVFKSSVLAKEAFATFNNRNLDGMKISWEDMGVFRPRPPRKEEGNSWRNGRKWGQEGEDDRKKGGIMSRLGARKGDKGGDIASRLGDRVGERLGSRIEDRLGKKTHREPKGQTHKARGDPRALRSYGDTEVAQKDGDLI